MTNKPFAEWFATPSASVIKSLVVRCLKHRNNYKVLIVSELDFKNFIHGMNFESYSFRYVAVKLEEVGEFIGLRKTK
ncbi:MAG TPA: hypothetical protein PLD02_06485 [Saprospiraceae bacterium]|nr:hypothetical protein [Saprospiraceae bacterium]